ncbi:MAG: ABC transporter ATP-binding protein/permease [Pygmaiobacter massiliensis]|nr:ABC transporter ATP-binding protein/permease [Pygmaiobacter massiliensis]MDY4783672.1 ABC transporter ATP-binding protein/permease [Pygmaiobacter massiliensis]
MMINKRLIGTVPESKKYIAGNVALQWTALVANIGMILAVTRLMQKLYEGTASTKTLAFTALVIACAVAVRFVCTKAAAKMGFLSSKSVKSTLRQLIYEKLLRLGLTYKEKASAAEVVQVAVEGVDQLETYFGAYLPQFFYSMLAPLTLFVVLCFISIPAASVLLVCVPLIPITIAAVQTFAKKLLAKYWGEYTTLGDTFLENLQGLTTMKIYQADEFKHQEMNEQSERFRKITMKVLTMQLNSITLMDALAYGGAALGVIMAATQLRSGAVSLGGALAIILLSADFYIPMRLLGSFFHIAMNGMAASEKIFRLLDVAEPNMRGAADFPQDSTIRCENLRFSYEPDREILHGINFSFPAGSFTAIVGESGCGKSTVASILMGRNSGYTGRVTIGGVNLKDISEASLMRGMTYVGFDSYLFKGTVRENLRMGAPAATEDALWQVLEQVNLAEFLRSENGLDTRLAEKGSNFSGGQRQRLALARAMLHDSPVYIFDEATSNVDVESENEIMEEIQQLAKTKTVILITHRLANAQGTDGICAMESGAVKEFGTHAELLAKGGVYAQLWNTQQNLEQFAQEAKA